MTSHETMLLETALANGDPGEVKRIVADAILASRNRMRGKQEASLVQKCNVAFGFARNLAGMKWLALALCAGCFAASAYGSVYHQLELSGTVIQALFVVIAAINVWTANDYMKHCATRYAEFFYAAAMELTTKHK